MAFIKIKNEVIKLRRIDYVTKKTAQKSQEDPTQIFLLAIVLASGVQINIPFDDEQSRDNSYEMLMVKLEIQVK